jgi:hypothetical protein
MPGEEEVAPPRPEERWTHRAQRRRSRRHVDPAAPGEEVSPHLEKEVAPPRQELRWPVRRELMLCQGDCCPCTAAAPRWEGS